MIDFGIRYRDYCSDVTIPFTVSNISEKQRKIVKTVEQAYDRAIDTIKIDIPTWQVHDSAEKVIKENGFEFKHSVGHGIGLEAHDPPNLSPKPKTKEELKHWKEFKLKENMIFTIEPGIYEQKIGGLRLENDILLKKKPKILTNSGLMQI